MLGFNIKQANELMWKAVRGDKSFILAESKERLVSEIKLFVETEKGRIQALTQHGSYAKATAQFTPMDLDEAKSILNRRIYEELQVLGSRETALRSA